MNLKRKHFPVLISILFLFVTFSHTYAFPYKVQRVINGDTIELTTGELVKYIGIDAPEKGQPFCLGAKKFNESLVDGQYLRLVFDAKKKDSRGRLLAYVYVGDVFVNAELLKMGYARLYSYPPNIMHVELFKKLQKQAREAKKGLWGIPRPSNELYYVGSVTGHTFHKPACNVAKKISPDNVIRFKTRAEALDKGYAACRRCGP